MPPAMDTEEVAESAAPPEMEMDEEAHAVVFALRQLRYAELRFSVNGQDLHLTGYLDPHYAEHHHGHQHGVELFIPFRDATSGKETYGAGRYLEVQVEDGEDGAQVFDERTL